jgi:2-hydroxy-6-oxonona-2,4-dienedioate hydrolase
VTQAISDVTAESTGHFVDTPTYRIHYYEAGTGSPVVLLHGSGPGATGWSNFQHNIPVLAQAHRVIAVDMPGWGESDPQTHDTGYDHPAALLELLDALELPTVALIGNSMGGTTALEFALHHPERISKVIAMGVPFPGVNVYAAADGPSEGQRILQEAYEVPTAENMKRLVRIMCFDKSMATDELSALRSAAVEAHPEHRESYLARPLVRPYFGLGAQFKALDVPVLAIHGRDDRVVHFEHSLRLVGTVPDSRLLLVNRCGHWVQIEHAAEFNRVALDFLAAGQER